MKKSLLFFCLSTTCLFFSIGSISAEIVECGETKLNKIYSNLRLIHGNFSEEYPEQLMSAMYLPSDAKVLELGGNVGRNSCVIAAILNDSRNLVTLESCKKDAKKLQENRDINGFQFHIEVSALSKKKLVQSGWYTIPSDIDLPGYIRVDIISFNELQEKYEIEFDTLVADCEGALYYILRDDPQILENINLVIIENDFLNPDHAQYTKEMLLKNGLQLVYNEVCGIEWCCWDKPCKDFFYQVWKK